MRPRFDDAAFGQDVDAIRAGYGSKPMRDHDADDLVGGGQIADRFSNPLLGDGVKGRSSLIE